MTEELLLRLAGVQSPALIRSLNLSSAGDTHIKFIENLQGCHRLQVLNLNNNLIQRMERLNALTQLRELQLAHNNIQRIEGLELMSRLQHLNLSHNKIDHVPVWLAKKLHSLHTLHLQHNLITSLYELSRLRSLSSLSELSVSGNPASSLPHSRLFLLYHVRTLDRLDDRPITEEERGDAHQRFNAEELQRLQRDLDSSQSELSRLRQEQLDAETRLHQQEETNRQLTAHTHKQRHTHTLLEQELHTKSQLLEKTTAELTRSFHRLYELEQELAFYKIDAKLSPLPYSLQEVEAVDSMAESPYIGKARHVRNTITSALPNSSSTSSCSSLQPAERSDVHAHLETSHLLQVDCRTEQHEAEAEQQAAAEHGEPEETKTHRQAQVSSQESRCRQVLDRMSSMQSELEGRLDDMLSRIAMETQEIKELEQQLTDGQILANEALQKDLEGIISGLQEYLRGLREQARCAQQQVLSLQADNQSLQLHLEDTQRHCRRLEDSARTHRQDMSAQQEEMSVLRMETEALRDRQVESSRQQVELDAELQQLREELTRQVNLGQLQCGALQAAVEKEKQSREIRESQLESTIDTLQGEKSSLQDVVQRLQVQLDQTRTQLDQTRTQLDQITAAMLDLQEVQSEPEELDEDKYSSEDMLSRSVEQLYRTIQQTRTSREQLQQDQNQSQEQIARLQAQLDHNQDHIAQMEAQRVQDQDRIAQLEAQVLGGVQQDQDSDWRLKEELQRLRVRLQRSQSRNRHVQHKLEAELEQSGLQLQDALQERDTLLQQLGSQSELHQETLERLNRKLRQLSRSKSESDQLTADQLRDTCQQLRALNHTVQLLQDVSQDVTDGSVQTPVGRSEGRSEDTHTVEELRAELDRAQRHTHTLRQELDRTRTRTRTRDGGQWCFVPPGHTAPSLGSLGTQDSGLGLQYLSSPERGRQQDRPPTGAGYWVYVPPTHTESDTAAGWRDSGGGSDADRSSRGQTPPPPPGPSPAAAASAGLCEAQTAWLLYGSPPGEHRDTQADRCVCECVHREAERLEEEKKKLRLETKQLRHTLRQHRSVMQVCDEVECVEKTLLKRRAELRQADRLLLQAQSCIHTCRDKAQQEAQDGASCLLEATQHIRELQEEVEELRRSRQQEEQTLRSREQELERVSTEIHSASDRLSGVLSDLQEVQQRLDSLNVQVNSQIRTLLF
ncbi:centriolin [Centropristis striata]|uniref:centriolin n=1 Tax=Centropristis striata TaxID=184440 RepID=UPI0027E1D8E2|nr:centriolin [Centropristis striata]